MLIQQRLHSLAINTVKLVAISIFFVSCSTQANFPEPPEKETLISKSINTSTCPSVNSRNWQAWIDRQGNKKSKLNISGEVDLPTPDYIVSWKSGILDRSQPPTQNLSISFTPPKGIVIQVITPTKVSFSMPSEILEYRSVRIYCEDHLLADIPGIKATK